MWTNRRIERGKRNLFSLLSRQGIGEPIRLLLTIGGISFVDHRYTVDEFAGMAELKARLPFGQVPALEVDGVFIGQTDSLMRLSARLGDLYPHEPLDAARADMIVAYQADIHSAIAKMSFDGVPGAPATQMVPEDERAKRIGAWAENALPGMLDRLERQAGSGCMVGTRLSLADVCVFNRLTQLLDINETLLKGKWPKLRKVYETVAALTSVRAWIGAHADDYPRGYALPPG